MFKPIYPIQRLNYYAGFKSKENPSSIMFGNKLKNDDDISYTLFTILLRNFFIHLNNNINLTLYNILK